MSLASDIGLVKDEVPTKEAWEKEFQEIGMERPEMQILWVYGNPIKRLIHDFIRSLLQKERRKYAKKGIQNV